MVKRLQPAVLVPLELRAPVVLPQAQARVLVVLALALVPAQVLALAVLALQAVTVAILATQATAPIRATEATLLMQAIRAIRRRAIRHQVRLALFALIYIFEEL